jgi:hypothetical protein
MTATARRGHGEGSAYRDAANGTSVAAISLGWRPDGSRIRRKVSKAYQDRRPEKLLRPVTMLIGQVPLRDLTAQDVRLTSKYPESKERGIRDRRTFRRPQRRGPTREPHRGAAKLHGNVLPQAGSLYRTEAEPEHPVTPT